MSNDIESCGIFFELQWKKKPGGKSRENVASIGMWADASLDWVKFKSYLVSDQRWRLFTDIFCTIFPC
jgi:hypothetical protein